jgi:hypothetical protein
MKRFIIAAAATVCITSAAYAETTVEVAVPANISDKAVADKYVSDVLAAVNKVCRRAASPVIGGNYYRYRACVEDTKAQIASEEPTGLLSAKAGEERAVTVAAR